MDSFDDDDLDRRDLAEAMWSVLLFYNVPECPFVHEDDFCLKRADWYSGQTFLSLSGACILFMRPDGRWFLFGPTPVGVSWSNRFDVSWDTRVTGVRADADELHVGMPLPDSSYEHAFDRARDARRLNELNAVVYSLQRTVNRIWFDAKEKRKRVSDPAARTELLRQQNDRFLKIRWL